MRFHIGSDPSKAWHACERVFANTFSVSLVNVYPWIEDAAEKHVAAFLSKFSDETIFLITALSNPDPMIAAYAARCLHEVKHFQDSLIPQSVFDRKECIPVRFSEHGYEHIPLGQFIADALGTTSTLIDRDDAEPRFSIAL